MAGLGPPARGGLRGRAVLRVRRVWAADRANAYAAMPGARCQERAPKEPTFSSPHSSGRPRTLTGLAAGPLQVLTVQSRRRPASGSGVTCSYGYINTARPAASPARGSTRKARRPRGPRRQLRRVRPSAKATKHAESRGRRDSFWSRDHRAADKSEPAARSCRGRERGHTRPPRPSLLFL